MSYGTNYTLDYDDPDIQEELFNKLDELAHLGMLADGQSCDMYPWYEHEEHMIAVSLQFPDTIFILMGVGEHFLDVWQKRFYNGEVHEIMPEIVWPEWPTLPPDTVPTIESEFRRAGLHPNRREGERRQGERRSQ